MDFDEILHNCGYFNLKEKNQISQVGGGDVCSGCFLTCFYVFKIIFRDLSESLTLQVNFLACYNGILKGSMYSLG